PPSLVPLTALEQAKIVRSTVNRRVALKNFLIELLNILFSLGLEFIANPKTQFYFLIYIIV
ncbi:MAG: hypothetical protein J6T20_07670, partial [Treponema sp.]|nr:hypothetical protein [Treponema sp.]